jgi:hypothetical protein
MLVLHALFDHFQQISSNVEIIGSFQCSGSMSSYWIASSVSAGRVGGNAEGG